MKIVKVIRQIYVMYENTTSKKDELGTESRETCNEPSQTKV